MSDNISKFFEVYAVKLEENVLKYPDEYYVGQRSPTEFAKYFADKCVTTIRAGKRLEINYDSKSFGTTCRALKIKTTRKAIFEFFDQEPAR